MRNKTIAALLAIFLGGLGMHKFYLGKLGSGIIYLLLCWTYIPAIIGLVEGLYLFSMKEENFNKQYNSK